MRSAASETFCVFCRHLQTLPEVLSLAALPLLRSACPYISFLFCATLGFHPQLSRISRCPPGKCYPCDTCHDGAEDHPAVWANRMLCGFCGLEQPFSSKPCSCGSQLAKSSSMTRFWEGGKGNRNTRALSKNDSKKCVSICLPVFHFISLSGMLVSIKQYRGALAAFWFPSPSKLNCTRFATKTILNSPMTGRTLTHHSSMKPDFIMHVKSVKPIRRNRGLLDDIPPAAS
jgi:hypothetical protein